MAPTWVHHCLPCLPMKEPREKIALSELRTLDFVLMRSKTTITGFSINSRFADCVKYSTQGLHVLPDNDLDKYDRVGFISINSAVPPSKYTHDNVRVTEATATGVKTRTLREVFETVEEIIIRPLYVGEEYKRARKMKKLKKKALAKISKTIAKMKDVDTSKKHSATQDEALVSNDADEQLQGAQYDHLNGKRGDDMELGKEDAEKRKKLKETYFDVCHDSVDSTYKEIYGRLKPMFAWILERLQGFQMTEEELQGIEALIQKHETDTGHPGYGEIRYTQLLDLLRGAGKDHTLKEVDTFSIAEVFNIVSEYQHTDAIHSEDLLRWWKASVSESVIARKQPRPIVSGAFVSEVLQRVGLLPIGEYFPSNEFMQLGKASKKTGYAKKNGYAIELIESRGVCVGAEVRVSLPPPGVREGEEEEDEEEEEESEDEGTGGEKTKKKKKKKKGKSTRKSTKEGPLAIEF